MGYILNLRQRESYLILGLSILEIRLFSLFNFFKKLNNTSLYINITVIAFVITLFMQVSLVSYNSLYIGLESIIFFEVWKVVNLFKLDLLAIFFEKINLSYHFKLVASEVYVYDSFKLLFFSLNSFLDNSLFLFIEKKESCSIF